MRRIGMVVVAGCIGLVAVSCNSTVSNDEFKSEMVKAGIPDKDAQCIVDGLEATGFKLKRYSDLSADDTAALQKVAINCAAKSAGVDPNQLSTLTTPSLPK